MTGRLQGTHETITVGPLNLFFTNKNDQMALPGHSHYATVTLVFLTLPAPGDEPDVGFPAFADTYGAVKARIKELTAKPFRNATNEVVARQLFDSFDGWSDPVFDKWPGSWMLTKLILSVQGVPDRIGHADGMTHYTIDRPPVVTLELMGTVWSAVDGE